MNKNIFGLMILIVIMVAASACNNTQEYTILFRRFHGNEVKKCSSVVRASNPKIARTIFETNYYVSVDSIVIDKVVNLSRRAND